MKVTILTLAPVKTKKLKLKSLKSWEPFLGMTTRQDHFQRETYIKLLNSRSRIKRIYISEN